MLQGSIIIVSHNSEDCIGSCLEALRGIRDWKIILVDNASSDSTVKIATSVAPDVCLFVNDRNAGFAGALNRAVSVATGDIFVLLNPDAITAPGSLDALVHCLSVKGVGAVGGSLRTADGQPDRGFAVRSFPSLSASVAETLLVNRVWPTNRWNRSYRCLGMDYSRTQQVQQPAGACLAIKREAWQDVGGFDENFFPVWFEDVDFCRRLSDRGWKVLYCAEAIFRHSGGHSVNKLRCDDRQLYWYSNLLRYFQKHHGAIACVVLRVAITLGMLMRSLAVVLGIKPHSTGRREALRAYGAVINHCVIRARWRTKARACSTAANAAH